MSLNNKPTQKLFYKISEVAEIFDINISAVRFWEKEFDILKPKKNKKGNRLFTHKDIENIKIIHYLLKERGFTVEGAKKKLKEITTKIIYSTIVELTDEITDKQEMEKIILIKVPTSIYPDLRKIFVFLFENSGFKEVNIARSVDFQKLYQLRKIQ